MESQLDAFYEGVEAVIDRIQGKQPTRAHKQLDEALERILALEAENERLRARLAEKGGKE